MVHGHGHGHDHGHGRGHRLMAVAIACGTLAFTHINSASPFWVESIAYPSIVFVCLTVIAMTLIQRFRKRIKATHDERWARRQERQQD